MEKAIKREYLRLRAIGYPAQCAMRAARVNVRFADLESDGFVRIVSEPEQDYYDDSYIDTWTDVRASERARARRELHQRLETDGAWIYGVEYLDPVDGWTVVDTIGGIIGGDFEDSGYDVDLKDAALRAWDAIDVGLCAGWV